MPQRPPWFFEPKGRYDDHLFESEVLKGNPLKDPHERPLWVSLPPGVLFVIGSFMVAESPRWLLRGGKKDVAYAALLRSRTTAQADLELREMLEVTAAEQGTGSGAAKTKESLLRRKYVIPFVLACIILACNQATGINSIIAYNTNILL